MPLARQPAQIAFSQGVDTKSDPAQLRTGALAVLENGAFSSLGRILKRDGFDQMSEVGMVLGVPGADYGAFLTSYRDRVVRSLGDELRVHADATGSWQRATSPGYRHISAGVSQHAALRADGDYTNAGVAVHVSGARAYCCTEVASPYTTYVAFNDGDSGGGTGIGSMPVPVRYRVQVLAAQEGFIVLGVDDSNNLRAGLFRLQTSGPYKGFFVADNILQTTQVIAGPLVAADRAYDAIVATVNGVERLVVVYQDATGGQAKLAVYGTDLVPVANTDIGQSSVTSCTVAAHRGVGGLVVAAVTTGTTVHVRRFTEGLALAATSQAPQAQTGVTHITAWTAEEGDNVLALWTSAPGGGQLPKVNSLSVKDGAAAASVRQVVSGCALASKAFTRPTRLGAARLAHNDAPLVTVVYEGTKRQTSYFTLATDGVFTTPVGRFCYGTAVAASAMSALPAVAEHGAKRTMALLSYAELTTVAGVAVFRDAGVEDVTVDFDFQPTAAVLANTLHVAGASLWMLDGSTFVPHGFALSPEITVTGTVAGDTYVFQFVGVFEWQDARGNTHRSAPSDPVTVKSGAAQEIFTANYRTDSGELIGHGARCVFYRTEANGTNFYRANPTALNAVTYSETDSVLVGNPPLYTTGGVIENVAPGAVSFIKQIDNRLWAIDATDPLRLLVTKEAVPGAPAEFSDLLAFALAPREGEQGGATAIASLDDKKIIFRRGGISYIVGQGPDATGGQNDWREFALPTEVGCVDPHSVVTTGAGVFFKSAKGIYLLDRSLQTSYIGANVEAHNAATVTSAEIFPGSTVVLFTLSTGIALAYDYLVGQWSVHTDMEAASAMVCGDRYTVMRPDGSVLRQVPGRRYGPDYIPLKIVTGWISLAGLAGFKRLYELQILGEYVSPHTLHVDIAYDYEETPSQTFSVDTASVLERGSTRFRAVVKARKQKCSALKVTIRDEGSISGEGLRLSAMVAIVGVKPQGAKLPAKRRMA